MVRKIGPYSPPWFDFSFIKKAIRFDQKIFTKNAPTLREARSQFLVAAVVLIGTILAISILWERYHPQGKK